MDLCISWNFIHVLSRWQKRSSSPPEKGFFSKRIMFGPGGRKKPPYKNRNIFWKVDPCSSWNFTQVWTRWQKSHPPHQNKAKVLKVDLWVSWNCTHVCSRWQKKSTLICNMEVLGMVVFGGEYCWRPRVPTGSLSIEWKINVHPYFNLFLQNGFCNGSSAIKVN